MAQEIARLVGQILAEYAGLGKKLAQAKPFAAAHADMTAQLGALVGKRFVIDTPYPQLAHFPRYLKGIAMRIDKLKADAARDARQLAEFAPLNQQYQRALSQRGGAADARLTEFRWLLEELRISLFAQELRTPMPVSVKAAAQGLGVAAALAQFRPRRRIRAGCRSTGRPLERSTMTAVSRRESPCAISCPSVAPPCCSAR